MSAQHSDFLQPSVFDKEYYSSDAYNDYLQAFRTQARMVVIDPLLQAIQPTEPLTFLDVGCGMGGNILELHDAGYEACGIEISPYCLEYSPAKEWMKPGGVLNIPYDDNAFDVLICRDVFPYLSAEEVPMGVRELVRVAKRYVAFSTIDHDSPNVSQEFNPDPYRNASVTAFTPDDYIALFAACGADLFRRDFFVQPRDSSYLFTVSSKK